MTKRFPIVCVGGASADIETYTNLLGYIPPDLGIAIVVINHMNLVSDLLLQSLPGVTSMPVERVEEGMLVQPNHVYIGFEDRDVHSLHGKFRLKLISKPTGWPDVITVFLRSITQHWRGRLIAVILSGYDGDGAAALRGIKKVGGVTFAQQTETAGQPDMPLSAIASGYIDFILPVEEIAKQIERVAFESRSDGSKAAGQIAG